MTSPVPQGYPDYARREPITDLVLVNAINVAVNPTVTYGPWYVANARGIYVNVFNNGANFLDVGLEWRTSPAGSLTGDTGTMTVRPNGVGLHVQRPPLPWLSVQLGCQLGATTASPLVSAVGDPDGIWSSTGACQLLSDTNHPIAAGATLTDVVLNTRIGEAYWYISCTAATWDAQIRSFDGGGGSFQIARSEAGFSVGYQRVHLTGGSLGVQVHNSSAAAASFTTVLTAHPFLGR